MEVLMKKKILDKYKISPNQFWLLFAASKNNVQRKYATDEELLHLQQKQFIKYDPELQIVSIRALGKEVFIEEESNIKDWIQEYRDQFKGLKPGAMGDSIGCLMKMKKFTELYPQFNKDTIIKAAELYISTVDDLRFLQQADYFIFKSDSEKMKKSRLASFCEEVEGGADANVQSNVKYL